MLIFTRKLDQSFVIGGDENPERQVKITVVQIKNGCVRLGFDVSTNVSIHRQEVWIRIQENKQEAKVS
jgi:carbon storage regulator